MIIVLDPILMVSYVFYFWYISEQSHLLLQM